MKASEVLKRYAEGRRDFRGENLRGLSFRGKDLSGADFSQADIRGTNFRDATLRGTQFIAAKAGLQKRWVVILLIISLILIMLIGFFSSLPGFFIAVLVLDSDIGYKIAGWMSFITFVSFCIVINLRVSVQLTYAVIYAIIYAIVVAYALAIPIAIPITIIITIAYIYAFVFAIPITYAYAFIFANTYTIAITYIISIPLAYTYATTIELYSRLELDWGLQAIIIASSIIFILGLLSIHMGSQAIKSKGNEYAFAQINAVAIAALTGTCFRNADLTDADFSTALLKNTDLRSATLIRTSWRNAKKLDLARVGGTILFEATVRELLVTGKGHRKSFVDVNLRGANLTDTDLSYANLRQADLSQATLRGANLEGANLTETNCVGADFTAATLTAACLEAWNIDSSTILDQVNCDYVFLLEQPDPKTGSQERRPHDPDAVFQPGDFEKLYRQIMNTVEILLRNGMNPDAFKQAFNQLMAEHPEIDYNSIQSIEKKGEDVLVTIAVPEETDKGQVERQFLEVYEARLEAAKQTALL